ncbi:hypothetical protein [Parafilimonas terrae]|uniref:Cytochrome C and Quinol oxidase polypeptide I n=1 Tax=Parafilimonas terrae TaxID=1465490 RepID=A0A1I5TRF8_9BACT|nr:hypothetical protein [Parafilimonas terrae]SFP85662.1 hypothetical protein SAMN05444277_102267 [Parafilimonas terrae]
MTISLYKWLRIAVFNLLLVAFLGLVMRYKIAFSLPFITQKYFLNAHSHFAFAGWITQALMTFIAFYIAKNKASFSLKKYNRLLFANLITAYGMLFCFPFEGYGLMSIIFSTLSIFVSYAFAIVVWRDLNRINKKTVTHAWIKAALIWSALSSIGPYTLAYMMATGHIYQNIYLASIYFYLHFQYNGWFFFTCMGLFMNKLPELLFSVKLKKNIFYAFAFACLPAYFLSALWLPIPTWIYIIVVAAAFVQVIAWGALSVKLVSNRIAIFSQQHKPVTWLFVLPGIALSIKLLLQLGSTIPALSTWAFGFRPIVIGYLHLVFLGIFSIFILAYNLYNGYFEYNNRFARGAWIFIAGIILNEALLMLQGLDAITYTGVPYINELLLGAAIVMFVGILILNMATVSSKQNKGNI